MSAITSVRALTGVGERIVQELGQSELDFIVRAVWARWVAADNSFEWAPANLYHDVVNTDGLSTVVVTESWGKYALGVSAHGEPNPIYVLKFGQVQSASIDATGYRFVTPLNSDAVTVAWTFPQPSGDGDVLRAEPVTPRSQLGRIVENGLRMARRMWNRLRGV